MIIDIRKDVPDFLAYIKRRVAQQVAAAKNQQRPKRVRRIDFGFEFGQGNELWLVLIRGPKPSLMASGRLRSRKSRR